MMNDYCIMEMDSNDQPVIGVRYLYENGKIKTVPYGKLHVQPVREIVNDEIYKNKSRIEMLEAKVEYLNLELVRLMDKVYGE